MVRKKQERQGSDRIGIPMLWMALKRHMLLIVGIVALFLVGATLVLNNLERRYKAQSTVVLAQLGTRVSTTEVQIESFELSRVAIETELDVLKSRVFAAEVAAALNLYDNYSFVPPSNPESGEPPELRNERVVDKLLAAYRVIRQGESLAIKIETDANSPQLAADIANTIARTYIAESDQERQAGISRSIAFLRTSVQDLGEELSTAEVDLAAFIRGNDLDDATLPERQRAEVERLESIFEVVSEDPDAALEAEEIRQQLTDARVSLLERSKAELRLMRMERELELLRSRYQSSIERLNELETQLQFVADGARQVTVARVPTEPYWPSTAVILGLGLVAGVMVSVVVVGLIEALDTRIWSESQLSGTLGAVTYGWLPKIGQSNPLKKKEKHDPLTYFNENPRSPYTEALRNFLTLWFNRQSMGRIVMVTSGLPSEGKSTAVVSIAIAAAKEGLKVLVLDMDTYRKGATFALRATVPVHSLQDVRGKMPRPEVLTIEGVPEGAISLMSVSVRAIDSTKEEKLLLSELRDSIDPSYDLVLIDTPPVLVVNDACRLGPLIDNTLFVVRWGQTRVEELNDAIDKLHMHNIDATATLINDVNLSKQRKYGYGSYSYYSYYGKSGYS